MYGCYSHFLNVRSPWCDLLCTLMSQDELELTRQALEKERLHSLGLTSRAEQGPGGEPGIRLGEVSWGPGESRWPRRECLSRGLSPSPENWVPKVHTCLVHPLPSV